MPPRSFAALRQPNPVRRSAGRWLLWVVSALAALHTEPTQAQASGPEHGHVPDAAPDALELLGRRSDPGAVSALCDFIRQGQPDNLTDRALHVLADKRSPEALPLLRELSRHRRPSARRASYEALARISDPRADALLSQGLRDSDAGVRGVCAHALGERRARTQLSTLFQALERGVPEAGWAVGQLADAGAVARLHGLLGRLALPPLLAAYEAVLLRGDIAAPVKLDAIARLGELATPSVKLFLTRMMSAKRDWSAELEVLRALAATAQRIDTRPGRATGAP